MKHDVFITLLAVLLASAAGCSSDDAKSVPPSVSDYCAAFFSVNCDVSVLPWDSEQACQDKISGDRAKYDKCQTEQDAYLDCNTKNMHIECKDTNADGKSEQFISNVNEVRSTCKDVTDAATKCIAEKYPNG